MDYSNEIKSLLRQLTVDSVNYRATVKSVNKTDLTCTVITLDSNKTVNNVRITLQDDTENYLLPKIGSDILFEYKDGVPYIVFFSQVEQIRIGNSSDTLGKVLTDYIDLLLLTTWNTKNGDITLPSPVNSTAYTLLKQRIKKFIL